MNARAWNTNVHKQAIVKLREEKAPAELSPLQLLADLESQ
jgi:hypothetical protein